MRPLIKYFLASAIILGSSYPAFAYIEAPMTLGDVVNQSNMITIMRVKAVDKPKNLIIFDKVEDIKGEVSHAAQTALVPLMRH